MARRRRINLLLIAMICIAQIFLSCATFSKYGKLEKSARDHYATGRYDSAVFECAQSIKLNPTYEKAQILIQDAFRAAVNSHERNIKQLKSSTAQFRWDDIVIHYESLSKLNEIIASLPILFNKKTKEVIKFEITDYTADLAEAKENAAVVHYQEGLRLSQNEVIDIQKQAAKEFKKALAYRPGYKDAEVWYEKCRRAGIKRMAIIPFADKSGKEGQYGATSELISDEVISSVMNNPAATEFLEIISRTELEPVLHEQKLGLTGLIDEQSAAELGKVLGVHEIMMGQITQIIYTPATKTSRNEQQKGTVSVKVGKDQYESREVHATVTFYKKMTKATITGSYKIIDVNTARLKTSRSFSEDADFMTEWATFSGHENALSSDAKRLIQRFEEPAPVEAEMVNQAASNLSKSLANALIQYAR